MNGNLIFDFDGTIADSFDVAESIFYELTGREPVTDPGLREHLRSLPLLKAAKEMRISATQMPRLLIKGRAMMQSRISQVVSFKDINPVLHELHEEGFRLFIISSNSQPNVLTFIENNKLEDCFDAIYGGIGLFSKARAIRKVMWRNKLKSKDTYYIGDEVRDINAAKRARVKSIAVEWGYNDSLALEKQHPFSIAKHPDDLLKIFGQK